jgi:hypothetical protein
MYFFSGLPLFGARKSKSNLYHNVDKIAREGESLNPPSKAGDGLLRVTGCGYTGKTLKKAKKS